MGDLPTPRRNSMSSIRISVPSLLAGTVLTAGAFSLMSMQGTGESFIHGDVREFLSHISMVDLPDGQGGFNRTVRISGINVQVVNGLEATNGYAANPDSLDETLTQTNGVGNLIVGYNELGNLFGDDRTGSHNMVVGHGNSYSSFGGLVATQDNTVSGPFSSVTGGWINTASGARSSVSGGQLRTAPSIDDWVAGSLFEDD